MDLFSLLSTVFGTAFKHFGVQEKDPRSWRNSGRSFFSSPLLSSQATLSNPLSTPIRPRMSEYVCVRAAKGETEGEQRMDAHLLISIYLEEAFKFIQSHLIFLALLILANNLLPKQSLCLFTRAISQSRILITRQKFH